MNKILVTGGVGFIGSNLAEELLEKGHLVTVLDNFATGKTENFLLLLEKFPSKLTLQVGDIRKQDDYRKALEGVEYVFHEAALGSALRSKDTITTMIHPKNWTTS